MLPGANSTAYCDQLVLLNDLGSFSMACAGDDIREAGE
jgi:hypothetical protein